MDEIQDGYEEDQLNKVLALSMQDQYMPLNSSTFVESSPLPKTGEKRRLEASDNGSEHRTGKKRKDERKDYTGGAVRITRTPGREYATNTVGLKDLIHPDQLSAAFVFSFCIEDELLFPYFPFEHGEECPASPGQTPARPRPTVDVYVGRDITLDVMGLRGFAGFRGERPKKGAEFDGCAEAAAQGYKQLYGRNFHAFYPTMNSGCAHSKMMILVYPEFLRLVITSANLMALDVVHGDNMWFIQDFPLLPPKARYTPTAFERDLVQHLEDLECPAAFISRYLTSQSKKFDFSGATVHLVTSRPTSFSGVKANAYGQLRLRHIVRTEILADYAEEETPQMEFEVCVGSVGRLETAGVVKNLLESCAGGRQVSIEGQPPLKMVFPTRDDVKATNLGEEGASNIGSHIIWRKLAECGAEYLQPLFHHYRSKDAGCLFHIKCILALHADPDANTNANGNASTKPPVYMYLGSHNFSTAAWGKVLPFKGKGKDVHPLRVADISNFECGVVIMGADILRMLEPGTKNWRDIVPYECPGDANRYKAGERPYTASMYSNSGGGGAQSGMGGILAGMGGGALPGTAMGAAFPGSGAALGGAGAGMGGEADTPPSQLVAPHPLSVPELVHILSQASMLHLVATG